MDADSIAVMSYSFASLLERGELTTATVVRFLRTLGVGAIEVMDRYLAEGDDAAVPAALAEANAVIAAYDLGCDFVTLDRVTHGREVERARVGLARAARLGARHVMVVPGRLKPEIAPAAARSLVIEGLRGCLDEAARLGLSLSIENLGYQAALVGRAEHLEEICATVGPPLGVTLDAGNFLFADEDPVAALRRLAPRVVHVHLKDWLPARPQLAGSRRGGGDYVGAPLGAGIIDLAAVVAELRALGYAGHLSVEYEGPGDPREAVRQGVAHLGALLAAGEQGRGR
ncbi:MAG TPA: sugar phosphate isomerase/epimerase family protein [Chloroflexota bacterium]|jgi:sugar phosphate isomerase/epimerase